jgi:hypothetical protein
VPDNTTPPKHRKAIWGPDRVWVDDLTWCAVEEGGNAQVHRNGRWVDASDPQEQADIYRRAFVDTHDRLNRAPGSTP